MSWGCIYTLRDNSLKLNFPFDMCRWLVEDGDVEVVHEVLVKHHLFSISRPLLRLYVGIAAAAIAQSSAAGGKGGPSDHHRFMAHHLASLRGGGDSMVADHWFRHVERVLVAIGITSDATRIRLATFKLESESQVWQDWAKVSRDLETKTWGEFHEFFMGKYFPATARHAKA